MEAISLILSAVIAGASAALKPTAEQAVKDAYDGLKALIRKKWNRVQLAPIEQDPSSEASKALVKEGLQKVDDVHDREVLEQSKKVFEAVKQHDPAAAAEAGVTIQDLDAGASVNIEDIIAQGSIQISRIKAAQDINIKGLRTTNPTLR